MKYQANRNYNSNDLIMTPEPLAKKIVEYFQPTGVVLEPCKGTGHFLKYFPVNSPWCEIVEGKDFFDYYQPVDWIITNPPWSKIRSFLQHSLLLADNVVFLMTINHLWTKARLRDLDRQEFGIREIIMVDTPKEFPQLGFQLGIVHLQGGYDGDIKLTDWRTNLAGRD